MPEFKCEHCGKVFEQEASLRSHVSDKHAQKPAEQPAHVVHPVQAHHAHPHEHPKNFKVKLGGNLMIAVIAVVLIAAGGYGAYYYLGQSSGSQNQTPSISSPIGALGSTHIHADFAVFLDGQQMTPLDPKYFVRNQFVHVESGAGAGSVIHMHATNVPLGFFFRSLGMSFNENCFIMDSGKEYCNGGDKSVKMFVEHKGGAWEQNTQYHTYVFQDLDKILITYGNETPDQIAQEENAVTSLAAANADSQMDLGAGNGN